MADCLFGIETEYGVSGGRHSSRISGGLLAEAKETLSSVQGRAPNDLFLGSGARLYIDSGDHPEFCTPECTHPSDALRHVVAGDRILSELADRIASRAPRRKSPTLYKTNVDLSGARTTWGCHESYLYRVNPTLMPPELIPHLVSRIIYTGAGGFRARDSGIQFTLSPRVWHLERAVSDQSTAVRSIFHTKNESLTGGDTHRMHLVCGESNSSHLATWLKVGTTALVVALADAGVRPGAWVTLKDPLAAMRAISADPRCRLRVPVERRKPMTAIDIQRHYLHLCEERIGTRVLPVWAEEVCRVWRQTLDRLEYDPTLLSTALDWPLKRSLYGQHIARRGFDWIEVGRWARVATRIRLALRRSTHQGQASVELVLGDQSPIPDAVAELERYVQTRGLSWSRLRSVTDLRKELFEIDMRFSQLGDGGSLFDSMDAQGVLDHRVDGVDEESIAEARVMPPPGSRAVARGRAVRELSGNEHIHCDWRRVTDTQRGRHLDLGDPFNQSPEWQGSTSHENLIARMRRSFEFT